MAADIGIPSDDPGSAVSFFSRRSRYGLLPHPISSGTRKKKKHKKKQDLGSKPEILLEHDADTRSPQRPEKKRRLSVEEQEHSNSLVSSAPILGTRHSPSSSKRRRTSESSVTDISPPPEPSYQPECRFQQASSTADRDTKIATAFSKPSHERINIDSDDDNTPELQSTLGANDGSEMHGKLHTEPTLTNDAISADDSEDEYAEIAARARARARAAEAAVLLRRSESITASSELLSPLNPGTQVPAGINHQPEEDEEDLRHVEILITSKIPNTKSLIAKLQLGQPFTRLRQIWCEKQGFDKRMADSVQLHFRGMRLWDATTCRSMGFGYEPSTDRIVYKREPSADWGRPPKIAFEAVSEGNEEQEEDAGNIASEQEGDADGIGADTETERSERPKGMRLILRAKYMKDVKVAIPPSDKVERLVMALRKTWALRPDVQMRLYAEGDKLDPGSLVGDTDLADMDIVEVHVR